MKINFRNILMVTAAAFTVATATTAAVEVANPSITLAWETEQSAQAGCAEDGKVGISASLTNTEPPAEGSWNDMIVTATYNGQVLQGSGVVAVAGGSPVDFYLNTGLGEIGAGKVVFKLDWANPDQGIKPDYREATFGAAGPCYTVPVPAPTATITVNVQCDGTLRGTGTLNRDGIKGIFVWNINGVSGQVGFDDTFSFENVQQAGRATITGPNGENVSITVNTVPLAAGAICGPATVDTTTPPVVIVPELPAAPAVITVLPTTGSDTWKIAVSATLLIAAGVWCVMYQIRGRRLRLAAIK